MSEKTYVVSVRGRSAIWHLHVKTNEQIAQMWEQDGLLVKEYVREAPSNAYGSFPAWMINYPGLPEAWMRIKRGIGRLFGSK